MSPGSTVRVTAALQLRGVTALSASAQKAVQSALSAQLGISSSALNITAVTAVAQAPSASGDDGGGGDSRRRVLAASGAVNVAFTAAFAAAAPAAAAAAALTSAAFPAAFKAALTSLGVGVTSVSIASQPALTVVLAPGPPPPPPQSPPPAPAPAPAAPGGAPANPVALTNAHTYCAGAAFCLHWAVNGSVIQFTMTGAKGGYVSLGFTDTDRRMVVADTWTSWVDATTGAPVLSHGRMTSYDRMPDAVMPYNPSSGWLLSGQAAGGGLSATWQRHLAPAPASTDADLRPSRTNIVWAIHATAPRCVNTRC